MTIGVSFDALGYGFDGQSAHLGFQLRPSTSIPATVNTSIRPVLQLRPGEIFHIGKRSFSIVPEEHSDVQGSNYEDYSQQVSQLRSDPPVLSSPMAKSPQTSPIFRHVVETAITGKEQSQDLPVLPSKRAVLSTIWDAKRQSNLASKLSPPIKKAPHPLNKDVVQKNPNGIDSMLLGEAPQETPQETPREVPKDKGSIPEEAAALALEDLKTTTEPTLETPRESVNDPPEENAASPESGPPTESEDDEDMPKPKKRKPSPSLADESQDSLFGKSIQVTAAATPPVAGPKSGPTSRVSASKNQHTAAPSNSTEPITPAAGPKSRSTSRASTSRNRHTASPAPSADPTSSIRSTRSAVREDPNHLNVQDDGIRVLFTSSSVRDSNSFTKFLTKHGVQVVESVEECTVLCVGRELKKTSKLIKAILLGKDLVIDSWVLDSAKKGKLQEIEEYFPHDPEREAKWNFSLMEAIRRGKEHIKVFEGWNIVFTKSAKDEVGKSGLADLNEIATLAGAIVSGTVPKKGPDKVPSILVIGTKADIKTSQWQCYTRDIISLSVLRGQLDVESDEFMVSKPADSKGGKKRKR